MAKTRSARPRRPAVSVPDTFESLDQTHRQVLENLEQLARLAQRLEQEGVDDTARQLANHIHGFFEDTARAHHAAEEQTVFPPLLAGGDAELVQHVQRLQQDHGWIEEDWLDLGPQLQAIAEGQSWYDIDFLRAAIPVFTDLYREHIALEETIVYPASRRQQSGAPG
jgi:hemerythrin-like domain-containing protein